MDRISRKDLKTDKFAEEVTHTVEYLGEHRKAMIRYGVIALVVIAVVVAGWSWRNASKAKRSAALNAALVVQGAEIGGPSGNPLLPTFPTQQEKEKAATKAFNDVVTNFSGSDEADMARYYLGVIASDAGRLDEAEKAFEYVANNATANFASLAKLSLSQIYATRGKRAEAEKLLRQLIDKPTDVVSKEQATIALARVLTDSNPAEARKLLEPLRSSRAPVSRAALNALGEMSTK